jgi:hypothetical protein
VGKRYDLRLGRRPLRIVVVGQEYGMWSAFEGKQVGRQHVTLEERYKQVHGRTGLSGRYYKERGARPRNPHMRGTTSALRILLGKGLGADHDGEFVTTADGEQFHIFDAFALVNVLLCSAGPPRSSEGRSSPTMRRNCLRHLRATLEILEPTVIVLQGGGVERWTAPVFEVERLITKHLAEAWLGDNRTLLCRFSHPSARGDKRWGDRLDRPYLRKVVAPTLRNVREHL